MTSVRNGEKQLWNLLALKLSANNNPLLQRLVKKKQIDVLTLYGVFLILVHVPNESVLRRGSFRIVFKLPEGVFVCALLFSLLKRERGRYAQKKIWDSVSKHAGHRQEVDI